MHHGHVLLAVPVVPEPDQPEVAEAGGQLGHRHHPDADPGRPESLALVVPVARHQLAQRVLPLVHATSGATRRRPSSLPDIQAASTPPPGANRSPQIPTEPPDGSRTRTGPASSEARSVRANLQRWAWVSDGRPAQFAGDPRRLGEQGLGPPRVLEVPARPGGPGLEDQPHERRGLALSRLVGDVLEHARVLRVAGVPGRRRRSLGVGGAEGQRGLAGGGLEQRPDGQERPGQAEGVVEEPQDLLGGEREDDVPGLDGLSSLEDRGAAAVRRGRGACTGAPVRHREPFRQLPGKRRHPVGRRRFAAPRDGRPRAGTADPFRGSRRGHPSRSPWTGRPDGREELRVPPVEEGDPVIEGHPEEAVGGAAAADPARAVEEQHAPPGRHDRPPAGEAGDACADHQDIGRRDRHVLLRSLHRVSRHATPRPIQSDTSLPSRATLRAFHPESEDS